MIFHILKNGQQVPDIEGHEVNIPEYYEIVERVIREEENRGKHDETHT